MSLSPISYCSVSFEFPVLIIREIVQKTRDFMPSDSSLFGRKKRCRMNGGGGPIIGKRNGKRFVNGKREREGDSKSRGSNGE